MRVLIVDDDVPLTRALAELLTEYQFATDIAHDGRAGLELAEADIYDLMIVDVMLPKMNGPQIVKILREDGCTAPILLLTARDAVTDRVDGLDSGADDYLVKPFQSKELLARVRALTRRTPTQKAPHLLVVGDFKLDATVQSATFRDSPLSLTNKEFQLLEVLARNAGRALQREQLIDHIWGYANAAEAGNLEMLVHMLRRKLDVAQSTLSRPSPPASHRITTVRGIGYCFRRN